MAISHPPTPPHPYSQPSSPSPFIFFFSVPLALIIPPSRLTAGRNWDWQSRVVVAGHQGLKRKKKKRLRETADESFVIVWMELLLQVLIWVAGLWVAQFQTAQLGLKIGVRFQPESLKFDLDLNKACGVTKTPLNSLIISRLVFDHAQGQSSHSLTQTLCV